MDIDMELKYYRQDTHDTGNENKAIIYGVVHLR